MDILSILLMSFIFVLSIFCFLVWELIRVGYALLEKLIDNGSITITGDDN